MTALLVLVLVAIVAVLLWSEWSAFERFSESGIPVWLLLATSCFLAFMPLCTCLVQNVTRSRQLRRLDSLVEFPVSRIIYFESARTTLDRVRTVSVDSDYAVAMIVYAITTLIGFVAISLGLADRDVFQKSYMLLGGWKAATPEAVATLATYEAQTFVVAAAAFLGCYVYAVSRLLDRVNNNDLYPISLYYYTVRVVVAVVIAVVIRHTAAFLGVAEPVLILVAFAAGISPDLFLIETAKLTSDEHEFLDKIGRGERADFGSCSPRPIVRGPLLRHLMLGHYISPPMRRALAHPGVRLRNARIVERLDLSEFAVPGSGLPALVLENCEIEEDILLDGARLSRLSLAGSHFGFVNMREAVIEGEFGFSNARARVQAWRASMRKSSTPAV